MYIDTEKYYLLSLFPTPLFKVKEKFNITDDLKNHLQDIKMIDNTFNLMSADQNILLNDKKFKSLKNYIKKWLDFYTKEILKIKDIDFYITQSWLNKNRNLDKHHSHRHTNSLVSGVFHFEDNMSSIVFERKNDIFNLQFNYSEFNDYNAESYKFSTEANTLILFPSGLYHSVESNISNQIRHSLSFNTFAKGTIGKFNELNTLILK